ncbi:MAG: hypothetical protein PHQ27_08800 [Victivallales bacterium]|nr:hypothetical protein [Victivallales bacterium]
MPRQTLGRGGNTCRVGLLSGEIEHESALPGRIARLRRRCDRKPVVGVFSALITVMAALVTGGCLTPRVAAAPDRPTAVIMNHAEDRNGRIVIAAGGTAKRGACAWRLEPGGRLLAGKLYLPELTVYGDPASFSLQVAGDNARATKIPFPVTAGKTYRNLVFSLPAEIGGATVLTCDVSCCRGDLSHPAAVMAAPRFELETMPVSDAETRLRFGRVEPWAADPDAADAAERPETTVTLDGPRNDRLTGAVMLKTDIAEGANIRVNAVPELRDHLKVRVVGQVAGPGGTGAIWEPIMSSQQAGEYGRHCLNANNIRFFPMLFVAPEAPVLLWLTVDGRKLKSGRYRAEITAVGHNGVGVTVPVAVTIRDSELPEDNPLYVVGRGRGAAEIRDLILHGANAFRDNYETAWANGARFLLFPLPENGAAEAPLTAARRAELRQRLDEITALVSRLHVPRDRWAVELSAATAATADGAVAAARYIRTRYPDIPLCCRLGSGEDAGGGEIPVRIDAYVDYWELSCRPDGDGGCEYLRRNSKPYRLRITGAGWRDRGSGADPAFLRRLPVMAWQRGAIGLMDYMPGCDNTAAAGLPFPVDSRTYEACRRGIQEYKRFWLLARLGVDRERLRQWAERMIAAPSAVSEMDRVDAEMDRELDGFFAALPPVPMQSPTSGPAAVRERGQ